ncbi:MAG: hypothetical protein FWE71_07665 [Nocardioidaceae bacterium]|nr:hypothetical protein [Nocardioidaceae bacterium]MCL2611864.1 hypothetical protein [Nocardioidaceae bacterium]
MQTRGDDATLEAPHLPRPRRQSRLWKWAAPVAATALLVGWVAWYVTTPEDLPTDSQTITASGIVGQPLYVGMFSTPSGFDRGLHMSGIKVTAKASTKLSITPLLCRHGSIQVTTEPNQFCASLDNPAGQRLDAGDSIVLRLDSTQTVLADIDQIRIAFQEGLRWGTKPAGHAKAVVSLVQRGQ